jgi:hypothetical protein
MSDRDFNSGGAGASENGEDSDAAFIARIAEPLRAPESLDPSFEHRLMSAVHADAHKRRLGARAKDGDSRGWWRRSRTLSISPLGLAAAAAIVGILFTGAAGLGVVLGHRTARTASVVAARRDTVHLVRFVFIDSAAQSVSLVGDFNGWRKSATQLRQAGNAGTWIVSIALEPGRHEYAFIVDGHRWVADPFAAAVHDEFGTESSVVTLTSAHDSSTS